MEKALAEEPGAGSELPSSASSPPGAGRQFLSSRGERRLGVEPGGAEGRRGSEAARRGPPGQRHGTPWGAQVTLPASSRSLQPSADTQQRRAGGGVRGRDGKAERKSRCCRRPQEPAPAGRVAPRGAGAGTRGARVGRSALAPPRPMARGSHPGRRRVRGRAQRRSRCRASCPPASLCLPPALPHQR